MAVNQSRQRRVRICMLVAMFGAVGAWTPAMAAPNSAGRIEFEVLRGGQHFGRQTVTVTEQGGALIANTSADLRANLGPISLFRYQQNCTETWRGGALVRLQCRSTRNGRQSTAEGSAHGDAFTLSDGSQSVALPVDTMPTSWWVKPPLATREMANTETGRRLAVRVTRVGNEMIDLGGMRISAEHIRVDGSLSVDLWYDAAGHWVSCAFTAKGQHITYRLLTAPASAPA